METIFEVEEMMEEVEVRIFDLVGGAVGLPAARKKALLAAFGKAIIAVDEALADIGEAIEEGEEAEGGVTDEAEVK